MQQEIPESFWEDEKWVFEHHTELIRHYKDTWIAVVNKKVVSYGKDLGKVQEEAKKKTGKDIFVTFFVESGLAIY